MDTVVRRLLRHAELLESNIPHLRHLEEWSFVTRVSTRADGKCHGAATQLNVVV